MFKALWSIGKAEESFAPIAALRRHVNVELRGVSDAEEFDAMDDYAAHLFVSEQTGEPIACARMYPDGDAVVMDKLSVMPEYEGQPYADLVLRVLLYRAQQLPQSTLRVMAEESRHALMKGFGFTQAAAPVSGDGKGLSAFECPRDGVIWDSACKHM